jgi:hypothetical protein
MFINTATTLIVLRESKMSHASCKQDCRLFAILATRRATDTSPTPMLAIQKAVNLLSYELNWIGEKKTPKF